MEIWDGTGCRVEWSGVKREQSLERAAACAVGRSNRLQYYAHPRDGYDIIVK